jgi:hypothetical protein
LKTDWIENEFSNINLGDKRLNSRFLSTTKKLFVRPDETINKSLEFMKDKKGAYRLFSHKAFNDEKIMSCHKEQTRKRIKEEDVILSLHDSSYFSYNSKPSIEGLGNIGGENTNGYIAHYALAMSTKEVPLGIQHHYAWSRAGASPWEKESERWTEGIEESAKVCPLKTKMIIVADREADQYSIYDKCHDLGLSYVIRAKHDRKLIGTDCYLTWHLEKKRHERLVEISSKKLKRKVMCTLKFGKIKFNKTEYNSAPHLERPHIENIELNVVEVKSCEQLADGDELNWVLFTNLELKGYEDALQVVKYYKMRWHIENFFKILKEGGCKVEKCSLRTFEKIVKYSCLFSIIAWRLYWQKHVCNIPAIVSYAYFPAIMSYSINSI